MKKNITAGLRSLVLFCALFASGGVTGQIVYTDIIDTTISRSTNQGGTLTYVFDINNDNNNDYNIAVQAQLLSSACSSISPPFKTNLKAWITTMPSFSNQVGLTTGYTANVPDSTLIDDASYTWSLATQNFITQLTFSDSGCVWDSINPGHWAHGDSGYIALKFKVGTQIYFGWVHLYLEASLTGPDDYRIAITVLDYAYNATPNQPILSGDDGTVTGLGSTLENKNSPAVFPNPVAGMIHFSESPVEQVAVVNAMGAIVLRQENVSALDLSAMAPGIYFLRMTSKGITTISRFIKS